MTFRLWNRYSEPSNRPRPFFKNRVMKHAEVRRRIEAPRLFYAAFFYNSLHLCLCACIILILFYKHSGEENKKIYVEVVDPFLLLELLMRRSNFIISGISLFESASLTIVNHAGEALIGMRLCCAKGSLLVCCILLSRLSMLDAFWGTFPPIVCSKSVSKYEKMIFYVNIKK